MENLPKKFFTQNFSVVFNCVVGIGRKSIAKVLLFRVHVGPLFLTVHLSSIRKRISSKDVKKTNLSFQLIFVHET